MVNNSPVPTTPDQNNPTTLPAEASDVVAAFEDQSRAQAVEYGYPPEKAELFTKVRSYIAHLAVQEFGITQPEQITEDLVKNIAITASPQLENELNDGEEERRRLKRIVEIDKLTGVGSQHAFEEAKDTAEADENVAFIEFDADNFKKVNDIFGHEEGNDAIKEIAGHISRVADEFGLGERVFRVGGDEFVVLSGKETAQDIMDKIVSTYGDGGKRRYGDFEISLSGGMGKTFDEADQELLEHKAAKKQSRQTR